MKTLKRLFNYIYKFKKIFIFSLILALFSVIGSLVIPILIGKALDLIIDFNNVDFKNIIPLLVACIVIITLVGICQWVMNILNNKLAYNITDKLRKDCFNKIQNVPLNYIDSNPYGEVSSKVIFDVEQVGDGLLMGFTQLFTAICTIVGVLISIFILNPIIALLVVVISPLSLFIAKFISNKTYNLFKEQSVLKAKQTAFIEEMVSNQKVVKSYNYESISSNKFKKLGNELEKCSMNAIFYSSLTNPLTRFVNSVIYAVVALVGGIIIVKTNGVSITIGSLTTLLYYANQYTKPFNEITSVFSEFQNTLACSQRVFELLDTQNQTEDSIKQILENPEGKINIKNVYFSYNKNQKLIENFNLNVSQGQKVAIVGPTGCGKTTLINLLMRFYDVNKGKIYLDDIETRDLSRSNLRKSFGMVLQDIYLKSGTIRDNIILGKPDATEEEIINASKKAYSYDFIKKLPNGFDTIIGEDGGNLSQGQKQLLCITRVMLCLPPLLILDEATSNIDTRTEVKIQNAFNELMKNKTSFIVAHRLSTIQNVDIILVMKDGNIIEQGNHEELLNKKGFYYELFNSQFN